MIEINTSMSSFTTLIQHSTRSLSHSNQTRRRNKNHLNEKLELKLSLFADDMILYTQNPKDSTKKLLELINEFTEVAGYKINIQKSVAFLHTYNELSERETEKTIPFTTESKNKNKIPRNIVN